MHDQESLERLGLTGCSFMVQKGVPRAFNVDHLDGRYILDLRFAEQRDVALKLIDAGKRDGFHTWQRTRYDGKSFSPPNWPPSAHDKCREKKGKKGTKGKKGNRPPVSMDRAGPVCRCS